MKGVVFIEKVCFKHEATNLEIKLEKDGRLR
jgi:hypothetical protein